MGQTDTRLGEQGRREDVIVVDAGAIGCRSSGGFKASVCGATKERAEERRLECVDVLMAETAAQVVLLSDRVVRLDVVADGIFVERKVLRKIVARCAGDVRRRRKILRGIPCQRVQVLQNGITHRADCSGCRRNQVAGERRAARPATAVWRGARAVYRISRSGIVNLAFIAAQIDVAADHVIVRNGGVRRRGFVVGGAKEVAKDEQLVFEDRAPD